MFEVAELKIRVPKRQYEKEVALLRTQLLDVQQQVEAAGMPVIVLIAGVDAAGKGDLITILNEWFDPRYMRTQAFGRPTEEERERPRHWRYWMSLPPRGRIGIYVVGWYGPPMADRVYDRIGNAELDAELVHINRLEKELADDGALIIKCWLHLSKKQQEKRIRKLEEHPETRWQVSETDRKHLKLYKKFVGIAERVLRETSTAEAPWLTVNGYDPHYRRLTIARYLIERISQRLAVGTNGANIVELTNEAPVSVPPPTGEAPRMQGRLGEEPRTRPGEDRLGRPQEGGDSSLDRPHPSGDNRPSRSVALWAASPCNPPFLPGCPPWGEGAGSTGVSLLSSLDLHRKLDKSGYQKELPRYQGKVSQLTRTARLKKRSTILVFEGWDAAGKGGAIRRITPAMDARNYRVIPIAAPTDEEKAHHYLWRFWRHLPRDGSATIYDRSWYGRVLVERVENLASPQEWQRAYTEINDFEEELTDHGIILLKYWMHISKDQQLKRFKERENTSYKRYKITEEDYRNRDKWALYEQAVNDMIARTSTEYAPWHLIEANDKYYGRIRVFQLLCAAYEKALD
jgi:polyphosphate kinase 2 (PPK2 family)